MRFESAQFKLSHEMTQLLDPSGAMKSETWNRFVRCALYLFAECFEVTISLLSFYGKGKLIMQRICKGKLIISLKTN